MYFIVTVNFSAYSMIDKGYHITEIFHISIGLYFRFVPLIYILFRQFLFLFSTPVVPEKRD